MKKEDLLELKEFLFTLPKGQIQVFINFKGQKIDTSFAVTHTEPIIQWLKEKQI
jgi:hypothetical protein